MTEGNPISGEWNLGMEHLDPLIAEKIIKSEVEGGIKVEDLPVGKTLVIQTENHTYHLLHTDDGYYLSGHPEFCPKPERVVIIGSNFGGSMLKKNYVGRGMFLEFKFPNLGTSFVSSEITDLYMLDKTTQNEVSQ